MLRYALRWIAPSMTTVVHNGPAPRVVISAMVPQARRMMSSNSPAPADDVVESAGAAKSKRGKREHAGDPVADHAAKSADPSSPDSGSGAGDAAVASAAGRDVETILEAGGAAQPKSDRKHGDGGAGATSAGTEKAVEHHPSSLRELLSYMAEGNKPKEEEEVSQLQRATGEEEEEEEEVKSHLNDGSAVKATTSSFSGRRRFYRTVSVCDVSTSGAMGKSDVEWEIHLDGQPLRTPGTSRPYRLPSKGLALALALEWDQQVSFKGIETAYMPLTNIATAALDELVFQKQDAIDRCLRYMQTDTVCFYFPESEEEHKLLRKQQRHWEPLLRWMNDEFGIEIAKPTHMLSMCENSPETLRKVQTLLESLDPFTLAATLSLVLDLKSVITALALLFRHITVKEAYDVSMLETAHQQEAWGEVDFYHELDESVLMSQVSGASMFLWLLHENDPLWHKRLKENVKAKLAKLE